MGNEWSEIESFRRLYGCGLDPLDESLHAQQRPITRRMAYYLWSTAIVLYDDWRGFARNFEDDGDLWRDLLPPVAERHANPEWLARFARCFGDVADRLQTGRFADHGVTNCTGDEVAVVILLQFAAGLVGDGELLLPENFDELLPPCGDDDEDFSHARDFLTADADVELLWDMSMDGIENESPTEMRFVNLHPQGLVPAVQLDRRPLRQS